MPAYFTQLWTRTEFESHKAIGFPLLQYAASNQFRNRGLQTGDSLFVLSCFSGQVWLLGELQASHGPLFWNQLQALHSAPDERLAGLKDHLLADDSTAKPMRFDLTIPLNLVHQIRFTNGESPKIRRRGNSTEADPQTFRGVRQISAESATLLRKLLGAAQPAAQNELEKIRALSIRQPYAERILRGEKQFEFRSWPTNYRGKVYIYAAKTPVNLPGHHDPLDPLTLPRGVIVGTMEIVDCQKGEKYFEWRLANPIRLDTPLKTQAMPQAGFFHPFGR